MGEGEGFGAGELAEVVTRELVHDDGAQRWPERSKHEPVLGWEFLPADRKLERPLDDRLDGHREALDRAEPRSVSREELGATPFEDVGSDEVNRFAHASSLRGRARWPATSL